MSESVLKDGSGDGYFQIREKENSVVPREICYQALK